jgi:hypothetical protein
MSDRVKNLALRTVFEFYMEPPSADATPVRFADERSDSAASASLLAQLSPVWKCALCNTAFHKTGAIDLGLTRAQFETVKDVWLRLLTSHPHPSELKRASAAFAIKLLIALDMLQFHPSVVNSVMDHAQKELTMEDVRAVVTDPEIGAVPTDVLEIFLPTLLEYTWKRLETEDGALDPEEPQMQDAAPTILEGSNGMRITNPFIQREVMRLSAHCDPRGLVWINRRRSVEEIAAYHLDYQPDGESVGIFPGNAPERHRFVERRFTFWETLPLDDTHAVVQYVANGQDNEAHHLICINTNTGEMVGRPQRIGNLNHMMRMNGHHFVFQQTGSAHMRGYVQGYVQLHRRTMGFFHAEVEHVPHQTLELKPNEKIHVMCRGASDLLFIENGEPTAFTVKVLRCMGRDDEYVLQYVISLGGSVKGDPFALLGGLVLSPTRVVLHFDQSTPSRRKRMKLQLFERDTPVCPACDVGSSSSLASWENHRQNGIDRLCHKFDRLYFFRDNRSLDTFDANTNDLSVPLATVSVYEVAALISYGARILVLPAGCSTRTMLFDPRTGRMAKKELRTHLIHTYKTIALSGGNVMFATIEGEFHIVKRVE